MHGKNKIAVLVGDYLLSKSVLLSTDNKDFDLWLFQEPSEKCLTSGVASN